VVIAAFIYTIVLHLQKKIHSNYEFIYLAFTTAIFFVVVMIGTGRLDYGRVIFPVLAIIIVNTVGNLMIGKKETTAVCCVLLTSVAIVCGIYGGIKKLAIDNKQQKEVDYTLENYSGYDCIYFRHRAGGYQETVNLKNMSSAQIITIDTKDWKLLADKNFTDTDQVLIFFTADTFNQDTTDWLKNSGYLMQDCVYDGETTQIYMATR
jgi:hypothetical protein